MADVSWLMSSILPHLPEPGPALGSSAASGTEAPDGGEEALTGPDGRVTLGTGSRGRAGRKRAGSAGLAPAAAGSVWWALRSTRRGQRGAAGRRRGRLRAPSAHGRAGPGRGLQPQPAGPHPLRPPGGEGPPALGVPGPGGAPAADSPAPGRSGPPRRPPPGRPPPPGGAGGGGGGVRRPRPAGRRLGSGGERLRPARAPARRPPPGRPLASPAAGGQPRRRSLLRPGLAGATGACPDPGSRGRRDGPGTGGVPGDPPSARPVRDLVAPARRLAASPAHPRRFRLGQRALP